MLIDGLVVVDKIDNELFHPSGMSKLGLDEFQII